MSLSITKELESSLRLAFAEAKARRHEHVTLEHLLYALLRDPIAVRILRACGARLRVLERAAMQVQSSGKETIDAGHVLDALYRERESHALFLLEKQGVSRLDLRRYLSHGALKVRGESGMQPHDDELHAQPQGDDDDGGLADDPLAAYCVDLVSRAAEGKIDPLIG